MTDKPVDKDPQNSVADTATSLKQTVEAKNNSSVFGVVQANSINDSTINIHVNNRVDKDEQPSKPDQNKKLHNSPKQTRFFTGRENELNQVDELFKSNKEVAISGMGGVGKTQTALKFCHLHINDYQAILWINAEKEESFNNSYYNVVDLLNLAGSSTSTNDGASNQALKVDEVISLVKRWLANNHNWLMVLDNLEDPKLIKDYLPANHQGHVLITTRSQSLKGYAAIVQLKKMSPETGTLFLLKRANLIPIDANDLEQLKADNKIDDVLITDAQKIVQAMDGLPLALEQAGAFIQESSCSLADYLKSYQDVRNSPRILDNDGEDPNDHASVYATFKLNFDVVKEKSVAVAKLLEVCSFLDSDLIPEEIFTSAGKFLGDELAKLQDNTYEFNNCLKLLLGYSLIERDTNNKSLSIHRLVQTVIRELIGKDNKKLLVDSLAKALDSLSNDDVQDPNNWPTYQRLLPSVTSFFDFAKLYQSNRVETAYLFHKLGGYCEMQALFTQSLEFYQQALHIKKILFDDYNPSIAYTLNHIGEVYRHQAKYEKALTFYNEALFIKKEALGNKHFSIAITFMNIATTYCSQAKYEEALTFYNEALFIYKSIPNFEPATANALMGIGTIYFNLGKYCKALAYYKKAYSLFKSSLGNNHFSTATVINNIAIVYKQFERYTKSLKYYFQALSIYKSILPHNHPSIAQTLNNISNIYCMQKKYENALDYLHDASDIIKACFGSNHLSLSLCHNNIGIVYSNQGKHEKAKKEFLQALSIIEKGLGKNHPDAAKPLENLGHSSQETNNLFLAASYYNKALTIYDRHFPASHPDVTQLLNTYSQLLLKLNRTDEAQPLLDRLDSLKQSP